MDNIDHIARFSGQYFHSVDEKGRIAVPRPFREKATLVDNKEVWFLTRGFESCLWLFTAEYWNTRLLDKLSGLSMGNKDHRTFLRSFVSPAVEVQADKQGRINLPSHLLNYAGLDKEVVFASAVKYIEIWDRAAFDKEQENESSKAFSGDFLVDLGL